METNFLWSDEDVEISKDGFLFYRQSRDNLDSTTTTSSLTKTTKANNIDINNNNNNEKQPFLLFTTARLLQLLYPPLDMDRIYQHVGFFDDEENDIKPTKGFDETKNMIKYQLNNDKEEQDDLNGDSSNNNNKSNNDDDDDDDGDKIKTSIPTKYRRYQSLGRQDNLANWIRSSLNDIINFRHRIHIKARNIEEEENITMKLVRTINSIRALFPHLLPMLNHSRRDDKNLVIGNVRCKTTKKKSSCWLLGTMSFNTTTRKFIISATNEVQIILKSFVESGLAEKICTDKTGSPEFWKNSWIDRIVQRSNPSLQSPMTILSGTCRKTEEEIRQKAQIYDEHITHVYQQAMGGVNMGQQYQRAVFQIQRRLSNVLASRFYGARLSIYGSCLSNLSLGKGSDVDISLWIPEADMLKRAFHDGRIGAYQYDQEMKELVYQTFHKINNLRREFRGMIAVTKSRIAVISGTYIYAGNPFTEDGSINFDVCLVNDIAVANSRLLREYSVVDRRVKSLMMIVKRWTKEQRINSAKEKYISSYTWMNLVIFYLQCIGFVPNLQSRVLSEAAGIVPEPEKNYWHFVNRLDTFFLTWDIVKYSNVWSMPRKYANVPLSILFYGFFEFYSLRFPSGMYAVSIKRGNISLPKLANKKVGFFFSIEDPFETYDSYCPHNLGMPANEFGSKTIRDCFCTAEGHLRNVLCSDKSIYEGLWLKPKFVEPEPTRNLKKPGFKRFDLSLSVNHNARAFRVVDRRGVATNNNKNNTQGKFKQKKGGIDQN